MRCWNFRLLAFAIVVVALVEPLPAAPVTTLLFDDFSGGGGNLPGTAADVGGTWTGSNNLKNNGTVPATSNGTAYVPVTIAPGYIYTLEGRLNPLAGGTSNWFALGFTDTAGTGAGSINGDGATARGWMLLRDNGQTQAFDGPEATNIRVNNAAIGNPSTVRVVLNTTNAANYTVQYFDENASIGGGPFNIGTPNITRVAVSSLAMSGAFDTVLLNRETPGGATFYLSDNFTTTGTPNTGDINFNLHNRQSGAVALTSWGGTGNIQSGNTGAGDKTILDGGNVLLMAGNGKAELNRNFNGVYSQGGLKVKFDAAPEVSLGATNSANWVALNVGADANVIPSVNQAATHFGLLFRENGGFQAFDGAAVVGSGTFTNTPLEDQFYTDITLLFHDPNDGNPFDGIGQTTIDAFFQGKAFYTFTKGGGGYANNFMNFQANGIGYVDNLLITNAPEPTSIALWSLLGLAGAAYGWRVRRRLKGK